jgi:hypothetical protein
LCIARSQKRFGHSRPVAAHRSAHLGDRLSGRVSRVGRERSERSRGLKRARVVLSSFFQSSTPFSHASQGATSRCSGTRTFTIAHRRGLWSGCGRVITRASCERLSSTNE